MRLYSCGCPAVLPDGSTDFGPRVFGEHRVWDFPYVSFAPDDATLPLYQHGKQLDYRANKVSMRCKCLAKNWQTFKRNLPTLPVASVFVPRTKDFHFVKSRLQYLPERHEEVRMHMRAGPLLDNWSQLPIPADTHYRYRAPLGG
ncbi:DNA translocase FtsK [Frankliniella fusca]|uniref:DNA translocase FtsK n=1 Tax=Frankliniella fusca TaxID=407009 RepID=A0AAE1HU20_9NEOP|nr:DNA translocase FtsK [Frankliniella fusca]